MTEATTNSASAAKVSSAFIPGYVFGDAMRVAKHTINQFYVPHIVQATYDLSEDTFGATDHCIPSGQSLVLPPSFHGGEVLQESGTCAV